MSGWPVYAVTCRAAQLQRVCFLIYMQSHTKKHWPTVKPTVCSKIIQHLSNHLSLAFRSAPWLLRASLSVGPLYGSRAQLTHTEGANDPINSVDFRPMEAAALVHEDNLTQSHLLYKQAMGPLVLLDL